MYERTFGTDWETLEDRDEVLWRAFALGVAEALGRDHPGELERISAATDTNYDRSFAELAYQKGRQHVRQLEGEGSPREIWQQLVTEKNELDLWADPAGSGEASDDELDLDDKTGLPQSLQGIRIDTLPSDSTDRVRRPSFLEKENAKDRERYAASDRKRSRFSGRHSAESSGDKDGGGNGDETDSGDDGTPGSKTDSGTGSKSGTDST